MKQSKEIPIKKNEEFVVTIDDVGFEGEGIARIDGFTVFIPQALKGEKVRVKIVKVLSNYGYGIILEILEKSKLRCEVDCKQYNRCGGCSLRHTTYQNTLDIKENVVQSYLDKQLGEKVKIEKVYGMENPVFYRNKLIMPVNMKDGKLNIGLYSQRSHDIVNVEDCKIFNKQSLKIANDVIDIGNDCGITGYDEKTRSGLLRNIILRNTVSGQVMLILVLNCLNIHECEKDKNFVKFEKSLKQYALDNSLTSVVLDYNNKNTNVVLSNSYDVICGKKFIEDEIMGFKFKISPLSFFQVNPVQVEKLYSLALEKADITKQDIVFDLYCGTGTIGILASEKAKEVYASEIIPEAIEIAKENAKLNNVENIKFVAEDSTKYLEQLLKDDIIPNIVILDPPRKGIEAKTIEELKRYGIEKIVYISCNYKSLARDLKMFEDKYVISSINLVDMFCYTNHVECVAVLQLKQERCKSK